MPSFVTGGEASGATAPYQEELTVSCVLRRANNGMPSLHQRGFEEARQRNRKHRPCIIYFDCDLGSIRLRVRFRSQRDRRRHVSALDELSAEDSSTERPRNLADRSGEAPRCIRRPRRRTRLSSPLVRIEQGLNARGSSHVAKYSRRDVFLGRRQRRSPFRCTRPSSSNGRYPARGGFE